LTWGAGRINGSENVPTQPEEKAADHSAPRAA
jgi:hypothetical protein